MKGKLSDGWFEVERLDAWPGHQVRVRAEVVDGEPRVTSLVIERIDGGALPAITSSRLRTLPVLDLARIAVGIGNFALNPGLTRSLAAVARRRPPKHDPRAATTVEQVAEMWTAARNAGLPPRGEVVRRLNIGKRTADRYIRKARDLRLIPD